MERGLVTRLSGLCDLPDNYKVQQPVIQHASDVVFLHHKITNVQPAPAGNV